MKSAKNVDCKNHCHHHSPNAEIALDEKTKNKFLTVRMCASFGKKLPPFGLANKIYIAFPTTVSVVESTTAKFIITKPPYLRLHKRSQNIRYCLEAKINDPVQKTWSPSLRRIIDGIKAKEWKVPYAFRPKQVQDAENQLPGIGTKVEIDCSDFFLTGKPMPDNNRTKGSWCNCDKVGVHVKPVDESGCGDPSRLELCKWVSGLDYCGLK